MTPRNTILVGDALTRLGELADASIDCVITSPPYYQLRDYGTPGQIGLEPTVQTWVASLRGVFAELARVLKPIGGVWLNLADSYSRHARYGAPVKSLLLAPERLLLALADDGWLCRNKVVWAKANPMPTSVTDRLNTTYDVVYFLTRSPRYYFDLDAIRLPHRSRPTARTAGVQKAEEWRGELAAPSAGLARLHAFGEPGHPLGKNPGDVWTLPTAPYRGAHFATFPRALVERPLLATCPHAVCTSCGQPWQRQAADRRIDGRHRGPRQRDERIRRYGSSYRVARRLGPLCPVCDCQAPTQPGLALDPFFGTGTVGAVARQHGRDWLGIELNPDYARLALARLGEPAPAAYWRQSGAMGMAA